MKAHVLYWLAVLCIASSYSLAAPTNTVTAEVAWQTPTTREPLPDGTVVPLAPEEIHGYQLCWQATTPLVTRADCDSAAGQLFVAADGSSHDVSLDVAGYGTYVLHVGAYTVDTTGLGSTTITTVSKTFEVKPGSSPAAPPSLQFTVRCVAAGCTIGEK